MATTNLMKAWQEAALQAKLNARTLRARWEREGRALRPGDLIDAGLGEGVSLLALERHPRHPSFVRVAIADERLDAGTTDVVVDSSMHPEPMVVRMALTRWVPSSALRAPYDVCDGQVVDAVLAARATTGEVRDQIDAHEVDDDPAHREHILSIQSALQHLPIAIVPDARRSVGRASPSASTTGVALVGESRYLGADDALRGESGDQPFHMRPLAAQSISTQMLHALQPASTDESRQEVPWNAPGTLSAVAADDGAELLFRASTEAPSPPPPVSVLRDEGREETLAWKASPDDRVYVSVPRQMWQNGLVHFRVHGEASLDIMVAQ